jgi:hypothetical protein
MYARVGASSGWPGDANTSCTIDGTSPTGPAPAGFRRSFAAHSSHRDPAPAALPQAHFR